MRIAMVGTYPQPQMPSSGGAERVTFILSHALKKLKDVEIDVVAVSEGTKEDYILDDDGVTVHFLSRKKPLFISVIREAFAIRRKIKTINPDIVHVHDPTWAFLFNNSYPLVVTIHGISWKETKFYNGIKWFIKPRFHEYILRRISHVIAISPYVEEELKKFSNIKRYMVEDPIDYNFFRIKDEETKGKIIFLGQISKLKDPLTLIKAIEIVRDRIPHVKLDICGRTRDIAYLQMIQKYIKERNLDKEVKILGNLKLKDVERELATCSLLCLPSQEETFGMCIGESMACGKPVIATRVGGVPWMIEDGKSGFLVNPKDPKAMAHHIIKLLEDDNLRLEMGKISRRIAEERWKPSKIAEQTLDVYRKVLEEP